MCQPQIGFRISTAALFCIAALTALDAAEVERPAVGRKGMVSSAHPLATEAGLRILNSGGNAFDAAVAIAATLNVVEPDNSGIGGYGVILIYDATQQNVRVLNCSGRIPKAVNSDVFRASTPDYLSHRKSAKAIATPTNLHAWHMLSERYGTAPWESLFDSAIEASEQGFVISEKTSNVIVKNFAEFPQHAQDIYGHQGSPLTSGDRLVQEDLARSLRQVAANGADVLYGGELGKSIVAAVREGHGFLALDDIRQGPAEWWAPISISYRGMQVVTASPPANSFSSLIRLGMMDRFNNRAMGHNSTAYLHRFAEVTKHAYWCRLRYAGDPDVQPPPLDYLLSEAYFREKVAALNLRQATPFQPPGPIANNDGNTTHFVVADHMGNIVNATQTLGNSFGSRIMPAGTGIWLNNSLYYCTFEPPGNPMDAHPGRRKLNSNHPTFVFRDGRPWLAIGTPGGHTIGQTVPQIIMNAVDFDMNIQEAIAAPRVTFREPNRLVIEGGIPEQARDELTAMGHHVTIGGIGNAHGLTIEYDSRGQPVRFSGGADPRGQGVARGY